MSSRKSIIFTPLETPEREPTALYAEPESDILVLGEMVQDQRVIEKELRGLALCPPEAFRGSLRVIAGAAHRINKRCARLLGEDA